MSSVEPEPSIAHLVVLLGIVIVTLSAVTWVVAPDLGVPGADPSPGEDDGLDADVPDGFDAHGDAIVGLADDDTVSSLDYDGDNASTDDADEPSDVGPSGDDDSDDDRRGPPGDDDDRGPPDDDERGPPTGDDDRGPP